MDDGLDNIANTAHNDEDKRRTRPTERIVMNRPFLRCSGANNISTLFITTLSSKKPHGINLLKNKKTMKWFIILTVALVGSAKAQQPDTALLLVHYKFSHLRDT